MKFTGATVEEHHCLQLEDLRKLTDQLLGKSRVAFDQQDCPAKGIEPLEIGLARQCFERAPSRLGGETAGDQRRCEETEQSDPVVRIRDRERPDRRKEVEVVGQRGDDRRYRSFNESPGDCDEQYQQQVREARCRCIDRSHVARDERQNHYTGDR